ncbi:hypothetical protein EDD37DRAFT_273330 [Exophiala viscosa]|uniref:uncharacterized protein n=1 Tax=Exophiala viscosa TaxID=2486360 RepID=UPI00218EB197|nr:hypothetical protein EDD37DRAFT_273330 [Exophiala viscosa]
MTDIPETIKGTRIKACSECRQQKLRCDASKDYAQACSRCKKFALECVISKSFRRVRRRTKSELQAELDQLKQQVKKNLPASNALPPPPGYHGSEPSRIAIGSGSSILPNTARQLPSLGDEASRIQQTTVPARTSQQTGLYTPLSTTPVVSCTLPQSIQGLTVDARDIDECFALFFDKHLSYMPIFDSKLQPNECYKASSFLFWTIVAIGSRRYTKDPTLILLLAPKVVDLAKQSIFTMEKYLPTIQAQILLCTWHMPIDTLQKDIAPTLAGAMLQMAMNIGLHVYGTVQDFSRVPLRYDRQQRNFRTRLWTLCLLTCQRVNNGCGLPPIVVADTYSHEGYKEDPFAGMHPSIFFQRRLNQVHSEAALQVEREALSKKPEVRNAVLGPTINDGLSVLSALNAECPSSIDHLFLLSCQLQLAACHLLASTISEVDLAGLYGKACSIVEFALELDEQEDLAEVAPTASSFALNLAALVIFRVGKSHISDSLDSKRGQKCYFTVIRMNKKHSVRSDDLAARATIILPQLWTSKMVVKQPDGTPNSLWLRCRSRLGSSVTYDSYWLWRQEFGGQPNPYDGVEEVVTDNTGRPASEVTPGLDFNQMGVGWSPETLFQDFQWPLFDEFAYDNSWEVNEQLVLP